jgi:hypothetical protein
VNNKATAALLVLFFGLLGAYWLLDLARIPTEKERLAMTGLVLPELRSLKPEEFRRVEIVGQGETTILERDNNDRWSLKEPLRAPASDSRVDAFIATLKQLRPLPESGKIAGEAKSYGLDPAGREVRLYAADPSAPVATLRLGDESNNDRERYVEVDGDIRVVDANFLRAADKPAAGWRDRGLFSLATSDVDKVEVKGPERDLVMVRDEDQQWRITSPIEAVGEGSRIDAAIAEFLALRVPDSSDEGFVADDAHDLRPYGLEAPMMTVTLTAKDGRAQVAEFGKGLPQREGFAYARRAVQDDILALDVSKVAPIGNSPNPFRSQHIFSFDPRRVDHIVIEDRPRKITHELTRSREGWSVAKPLPGPADFQTIAVLIKALRDAQASEFFERGQVPDNGLDSPSMIISISEQPAPGNPAKPVTLKIGKRDPLKKVVYAQTEGDPTLLVLTESILPALPESAEWFRDRTVLTLNTRQVAEIERNFDDRISALKATNGGVIWRMTRPVAAPADTDSVTRLQNLLGNLRAERLIALSSEGDAEKYGLDRPWMSLTWTLAGEGNGSQALAIGKVANERTKSRYAKLSGQPAVFTLPAPTLAALSSEWHETQVLSFAAESATSLRMTWPGRDIDFARAPGHPAAQGWKLAKGEAPKTIGDAQADLLVRQLASLRANRFVQYDGPIPDDSGLARPALAIEVSATEKGKAATHRLRLGRLDRDGWLATLAEEGKPGPVFTLPADIWGAWIHANESDEVKLPDNVFAPEN